jgi:hypothetical protein
VAARPTGHVEEPTRFQFPYRTADRSRIVVGGFGERPNRRITSAGPAIEVIQKTEGDPDFGWRQTVDACQCHCRLKLVYQIGLIGLATARHAVPLTGRATWDERLADEQNSARPQRTGRCPAVRVSKSANLPLYRLMLRLTP